MIRFLLLASSSVLLGACSATSTPLETVDHVDLERFMGDWYVIAHIPTPLEDEAYNAVESYSLNPDGTIATTFTFREGGFDGERRRYTPKGFVLDTQSNAVWGMRFVWPIKADYRILFLDDDYATTVIGRNKRDYVWLMARQPEISDRRFADALVIIEKAGYDPDQLRMVPQEW
jgi:apolipoprotein D and lipocalin family protein